MISYVMKKVMRNRSVKKMMRKRRTTRMLAKKMRRKSMKDKKKMMMNMKEYMVCRWIDFDALPTHLPMLYKQKIDFLNFHFAIRHIVWQD